MDDHAPQRQRRAAPTRYLMKDDVRQRYGWQAKVSVDRAWKKYGTLPPPIYRGKFPMWNEQELDAHDAGARKSTVVIAPERREAIAANLDRARRVLNAKRQRRHQAQA